MRVRDVSNQLTSTVVARFEGGVQQLPSPLSVLSMEMTAWDAILERLAPNEELQEDLAAFVSESPPEGAWDDCIRPAQLARVLKAARKYLGLTGQVSATPRFSIELHEVVSGAFVSRCESVALLDGGDTLWLSVPNGEFMRINQRTSRSATEPLRAGLEISGSPVGEPRRHLLARVVPTGGAVVESPEPNDLLASALRCCTFALSQRARLHVSVDG